MKDGCLEDSEITGRMDIIIALYFFGGGGCSDVLDKY
jgi:hypothetical protein